MTDLEVSLRWSQDAVRNFASVATGLDDGDGHALIFAETPGEDQS